MEYVEEFTENEEEDVCASFMGTEKECEFWPPAEFDTWPVTRWAAIVFVAAMIIAFIFEDTRVAFAYCFRGCKGCCGSCCGPWNGPNKGVLSGLGVSLVFGSTSSPAFGGLATMGPMTVRACEESCGSLLGVFSL